MQTTSQQHVELKKISKQVKNNIYDMLRLADSILSDHEYVDQFGGEIKLMEMMESDEFGHFGGNPPLATMLTAFRKSPARKQWEQYKFDIRAMILVAQPPKERRDGERSNWKAKAAELQTRVDQLDAALIAERQTTELLRDNINSLRDEIKTLTIANGKLQGEITTLREFCEEQPA